METNYPAPQDPAATAAAQTASNKETAVANANLNRIDQYTPQGSVTYTKIGMNEDGTPKYQSNQTYSPDEQNIFNLGQQTRTNIGNIGVQQSAKIGDLLNSPVDLNSGVDQKLFDLGRARLDPVWQQREEQMSQKLANQGIGIGTEAYDRAMSGFGNSRNDAYNQLALTGRGQAVQEVMAQRNQPINEISALMSGSQVSQPNFVGVPQANMANTDVAGIYGNAFNQQMQIANAQNSTNNAMIGGAAGLAGNAMRFIPWSDRRLKKNIVALGADDTGLMVYRFNYIWDDPATYVGYMADNVAEMYPGAVVRQANGFDAVDYGRIG